MSQYRVLRLLLAMAALGGLATVGCGDDADDDGKAGEGVMKFCNELFVVDSAGTETAADLTVIFAGVEATALSGTCTPVVPNACIPVPAGANPSVILQDPSTNPPGVVASGTFPTLTVEDGDELFVVATMDSTETMPTVTAGAFNPQFVCAETDPFAVMLETKSAPFEVVSQHSLRAQQNVARARWMRKAVPAGLGR